MGMYVCHLHSENAPAKVRPEPLQQAGRAQPDGVVASLERVQQQAHAAGERLGLKLAPVEGALRRQNGVGDGHAAASSSSSRGHEVSRWDIGPGQRGTDGRWMRILIVCEHIRLLAGCFGVN